jgi:MFS family permease
VVVMGLAIGSVIPMLSSASNAYLPANRFAMGAALYTTGRQVGAALGLATVGALQGAAVGVAGFQHSYWYLAGVMMLAAVVMFTTYRKPTASDLVASESHNSPRPSERPSVGSEPL